MNEIKIEAGEAPEWNLQWQAGEPLERHRIIFADGSFITLKNAVEGALAWRHAKSPGAVDRAMNREQHASERAKRAEQHEAAARGGERVALRAAATLKHKLGKVIEQAGAWKRRALAAESALDMAREQAREREIRLVAKFDHQLLEAQARALDTLQRIAAQLPAEPIIDAEVVVPDVEVDTWFGEDNTPVVQIDTPLHHGRLRINLNDGVVWDGDPETDERPGAHAEALPTDRQLTIHIGGQQAMKATISRQLDTIRDQAEKIERLDEVATANGEALATLQGRMDSNLRAFRALEARKVELEAEVLAERGALAVCQTQLTDTKAELAESNRAFDAMDSRNRELAEKVAQLEEQRAEAARNLSQVSAERAQAWRDLDVSRVADLDALRAEKAEAIAHCNEQLEALAQTAKLRDRQVETLSRLWVAKTDDERSLFGTVFARQLYRVFADHGIDVEHDMPAYPANVGVLITPAERLVTEHAQLANAAAQLAALTLGQAVSGAPKPHDTARYVLRLVGGKAGPVPEQPVTDRILREYNHLREHAELVASIGVKATGPFYPTPLRDAIKELNGALKNGAPEPTPDIADCA